MHIKSVSGQNPRWVLNKLFEKLFNCNVFANITDTQETRRSTPFAKTDYCLHQNYRDLPASTAAVPETNSNLKFKKFAKKF